MLGFSVVKEGQLDHANHPGDEAKSKVRLKKCGPDLSGYNILRPSRGFAPFIFSTIGSLAPFDRHRFGLGASISLAAITSSSIVI